MIATYMCIIYKYKGFLCFLSFCEVSSYKAVVIGMSAKMVIKSSSSCSRHCYVAKFALTVDGIFKENHPSSVKRSQIAQ